MKFEVGSSVVIARKVESRAKDGMGEGREWENAWVEGMDELLGKTFTVKHIDPYIGITFEEDDWFYFPLTALDPA